MRGHWANEETYVPLLDVVTITWTATIPGNYTRVTRLVKFCEGIQ